MLSKQKMVVSGLCVGIVLAVGLLALWAKGERNRTYTGTVEWRFEVSAFYPNGNCAARPYWLSTEGEAATELHRRWEELGRPGALRVRFVGDLSRVGTWGHLGGYVREIRPRTFLEVIGNIARLQMRYVRCPVTTNRELSRNDHR